MAVASLPTLTARTIFCKKKMNRHLHFECRSDVFRCFFRFFLDNFSFLNHYNIDI